MEEIVIDDFDVWLANFKIAEVNYVAVFDPFSGKVISVGPDTAFKDEKHKVNIDTLIAESIIMENWVLKSVWLILTLMNLKFLKFVH